MLKSRFAMLVLPLTLMACASTSQYPVSKIHQSSRCPTQEKTLRLLESSDELAHLTMSRLMTPANEKPGDTEVEPDVEKNWLVLFALGQKPTAGYSVSLTEETATVASDVLNLPVAVHEPAQGTLQAQVITSPCLIVSVPKGQYRAISAADQLLSLPE